MQNNVKSYNLSDTFDWTYLNIVDYINKCVSFIWFHITVN